MILVRWALLWVFLVPVTTYANPLALIYTGPGACQGCPESVGEILDKQGFQIRYVGPQEINRSLLSTATLYVQPGGSDRVADTLEKLPRAAVHDLKSFVKQGGVYLGICAGAYMAADKLWDEGRFIQGLGLWPGSVVDEVLDPRPRLIKIIWKSKFTRSVYFQDGPRLPDQGLPNTKIWAIYAHSGHIAAVMGDNGKGRVGLIGPHLEADEDWFVEDHLQTPAKLSTDLFLEFVRSLLDKKS